MGAGGWSKGGDYPNPFSPYWPWYDPWMSGCGKNQTPASGSAGGGVGDVADPTTRKRRVVTRARNEICAIRLDVWKGHFRFLSMVTDVFLLHCSAHCAARRHDTSNREYHMFEKRWCEVYLRTIVFQKCANARPRDCGRGLETSPKFCGRQ